MSITKLSAYSLQKTQIARSFNDASQSYDQHAFIQNEVGQRLLEKVKIIKEPPQTILDLGAATGF